MEAHEKQQQSNTENIKQELKKKKKEKKLSQLWGIVLSYAQTLYTPDLLPGDITSW